MKHSTIFYFCLVASVGLYGIDNPDMGISDLNVIHKAGIRSTPKLVGPAGITSGTKLDNVPYDDDTGTQVNITVSILATDAKPTVVRIYYTSSPWLLFEDNEYYDVRFVPSPTSWTGYGKTGHVVDDDISDLKSRRLEW